MNLQELYDEIGRLDTFLIQCYVDIEEVEEEINRNFILLSMFEDIYTETNKRLKLLQRKQQLLQDALHELR